MPLPELPSAIEKKIGKIAKENNIREYGGSLVHAAAVALKEAPPDGDVEVVIMSAVAKKVAELLEQKARLAPTDAQVEARKHYKRNSTGLLRSHGGRASEGTLMSQFPNDDQKGRHQKKPMHGEG